MRGRRPVQAPRQLLLGVLSAAASACVMSIADLEQPPPDAGGGSSGHPTASSAGGGDAATTGASGGAGATAGAGPGGAGGAAGQGGAGGSPPPQSGCADATREAYQDDATFADIAGCAGGFAIAGATTAAEPGCIAAGDDSSNPSGTGCSAANLCEPGWHVCSDRNDVDAKSNGTGCPADGGATVFWLTGQTENVAANSCDPAEGNNLVGCGDLGGDASNQCGPLTRRLREKDCGPSATMPVPPWSCPDPDLESVSVTKPGPEKGGVLCCRD